MQQHRPSTKVNRLSTILLFFALSIAGGLSAGLIVEPGYLQTTLAFLSGALLGFSAEKLLTLRLRRLTEDIESLLG